MRELMIRRVLETARSIEEASVAILNGLGNLTVVGGLQVVITDRHRFATVIGATEYGSFRATVNVAN